MTRLGEGSMGIFETAIRLDYSLFLESTHFFHLVYYFQTLLFLDYFDYTTAHCIGVEEECKSVVNVTDDHDPYLRESRAEDYSIGRTLYSFQFSCLRVSSLLHAVS